MNRVEFMSEAGRSYSVKFREFTRIYSKDKKLFICIFEGEDEKYFSQRITSSLNPLSWQGINAGGKKAVLELHECVYYHPIYQKSRYLCFIDRDFDDWFENPDISRIYVTPCYSIENLYVSESSFVRIISSEFGITQFNDYREDFKKCLRLFNQKKNEFLEIISTFNYWVKAHRLMERNSKTVKKLNVRNIKLEALVQIKINSLEMIYDPEKPELLFKDSKDIKLSSDAVLEARKSIPGTSRECLFRGKQNIDFLRVFLCRLKEDRTSKYPVFFGSRGAVKISLSRENIISELSQYAETPECLVSFLNNAKTAMAA